MTLGRVRGWAETRPNLDVVIGVTAVALVVRLVAVLATIHHLRISADAADYLRLGHSLNDGHGWGRSGIAPGGGPEGLRPPGYPLWIAAVLRTTGGGLTTIRLVGGALGATVAPMVAGIGLAIRPSRRVATIAGALAAVLPSLVIASVTPMSESVFVPMSLAVISLALAYRHRPRAWLLATAGLLVGGATLVRPVGVVLVVPVVWLAFRTYVAQPRRLLAGGVALALAVAPVAAWEVREINAFHTVVPLTTQGGYLVAGTYNATSAVSPGQHGVWIPYFIDPTDNALIAAHPDANEAQVSSLLDHAATRYLEHHPRYLGTVLTDDTLRLFDLTNPSFARHVTESEYGVGSVGGWAEDLGGLILLMLAVAGVARGGLRRRDLAVWVTPLLLILVTIPDQSFTRFRAPIDPFLVLLAAVALAELRWPRRPAVAHTPAAAVADPVDAGDAQPTPLIASLTSLRFVAALGVFFVHTFLIGGLFPHAGGYLRLVTAGATGVSFFFILSGFVLTWSHRPAEPGRRFIQRRAARILPNHVLTWAATAVIYSAIGIVTGAGPVVTNLFLVHAWVPIESWYDGMNTPSWSLCCEAFFYVLFPVLLVWLRRMPPPRARLVAGAGLVVTLLAAVLAHPLASATSPQVGNWLVVDLPITRLGEFVLGIVIALELRRGTLPRISPALAAASVAIALAIVDVANSDHLLVVVTVVPFAALIAAVARRELDGGMRWLRHPMAVRLGQWSFAFYLVHWLVLVEALRLHPHPYSGTGAVAVVVLSLLASIAISAIVFELWERPMERALRPRHQESAVTTPSNDALRGLWA